MTEGVASTFKQLSEKYPSHSTFIIFEKTLVSTKVPASRFTHYFNTLVDKDDYAKKDKKILLKKLREFQTPKIKGFSITKGLKRQAIFA